jgi:hypothetical protein
MRTKLLTVAMGLLAAGCEPPGFGRLGVYGFEIGFASFGDDTATATFRYDSSKGCESLDPSLSVQVNGTEVQAERGGLHSTFRDTCTLPAFGVPRPQSIGELVSIDARCQDTERASRTCCSA